MLLTFRSWPAPLSIAAICLLCPLPLLSAEEGERIYAVSVRCPGGQAVIERRSEFEPSPAGGCRERLVAVVNPIHENAGSLAADHAPAAGTITEKPGWPRTFSELKGGPINLADLGDPRGLATVFRTGDATLHALSPDGQELPGWPILLPLPSPLFANIAAVDMLGDPRDELLVDIGPTYALSPDGEVLPGWPFTGGAFGFPIGVPFHSGGPIRVVGAGGRPPAPVTTAGVYVLDEAGDLLPGWPAIIPKGNFARPLAEGPAVGDVTADGLSEVVVTVLNEQQVWVFDAAGETLPGFPLNFGIRPDNPSLGDIDGDGKQEIAFWGAILSLPTPSPGVVVLDDEASIQPGWPQVTNGIGNFGPAIGDLDGDGLPEVVGATVGGAGTGEQGGGVWVWRHDGTPLPGWPKFVDYTGFDSPPTLADVDGDGQADVLAVGSTSFLPLDGVIYAWKSSGELVEGFPIIIPFRPISLGGSAAVADIDRDGIADLGVSSDPGAFSSSPARIHWFDLGVPFRPEGQEWPTISHDMARTGSYSPPVQRVAADLQIKPPVLTPQGPAPPVTVLVRIDAEIARMPDELRLTRIDGTAVSEQLGMRVNASPASGRAALQGFDRVAVYRFAGEPLRDALGQPGPHVLAFRSEVIGGPGGVQLTGSAEVSLR